MMVNGPDPTFGLQRKFLTTLYQESGIQNIIAPVCRAQNSVKIGDKNYQDNKSVFRIKHTSMFCFVKVPVFIDYTS